MLPAIDAFDLQLLTWSRGYHAPWLDAVMTFISASGGAGLIWLVLAAVALAIPRHRAAAWRVMLAVALSYALVDAVLKPLVARPRRAMTASFPSGHATATVAAAVAVSRMWPATRVVWWTLAVLIGYSRIYLGHHYPLDVIGGAILGVATAMWVLGGRHRATYANTWPTPLAAGVIVKP